MGRSSAFLNPKEVDGSTPKSLRNNAREAAEYLTGLPYLPPKALKEPTEESFKAPIHKPGRGVSGESSN